MDALALHGHSKTVTAGNTWQTAIDLSIIPRFNRFYESDDNAPIKLFDGNNRIVEYTRSLQPAAIGHGELSPTASATNFAPAA